MAEEKTPHGPCHVDVEIHSPALWGLKKDSSLLNYAVPRLHFQLAIIFLLTESIHRLLKRLHLPRFASEILAGIMLGPTVLGRIPHFKETFFPREGEVLIDALAKIGFIFFIFLSGVKMDPSLIMTAGAGTNSAWTVGALAPLIPFAGGMTISKVAVETGLNPYRWTAVKSIITVTNLYAFPVTAALLVDLKIMNSELGRLALTTTLISDLLSNILSSLASYIRIGYAGWMNAFGALIGFVTIGCVAIFIVAMRQLSRWIIQQTPEGKPIKRVYVIVLSAAVLLSAIISDNIGLVYQHGPFLLGLALPDGPPAGSTLVNKLETVMCGWLTPLIVTYCGMKVNLLELINLEFAKSVWGLAIASLSMKFGAIVFPALVCKMPVRDAIALAFAMCTQGVVHLTYYVSLFLSQAYEAEVFSMLTTATFLVSIVTQLGAKTFYDQSRLYTGYQKRDIQHMSSHAELRLLTCSHRADDVIAVKRILEASYPNKESPLAVYALNLVELIGRAHPLLIDHQLGQKASMVGSHAQKSIEMLHSFAQQYVGMISIQLFTSLSLPRFMHDDVCSLAFDKLTSMIILPFHKKWNHQGKIVSDSGTVRAINCNVLDMAPCSVGILVDRHRIKNSEASSSPTYNVVVVFIGGNDDREALAYGRRMARSHLVHLSVIRFVPWDPTIENQWDSVIDAEILKETRLQSTHQDNIVYREERVRDGADTALQVHSLEEGFDLIMVGRRHREECQQLSGLNEWSELPELGPVGDILASSDISKPVAVLIVQQQIVRTK